MRRIRKLAQHGDTIVEVLIAIAIVSMVLGGAYATTNKSLQASRSSQEQGVALKLVETQIEQLKALADTTGGLATAPSSFCILTTGAGPTIASTVGAGNPCGLNSSGTTAAATDQPVYQLAITEPSANVFQITNNWTNVSGGLHDTIQMTYKAYPQ